MKNILVILFTLILSLIELKAQVNTNISNATSFNGEPYLVVNPTNSQNICIAWMGYLLTNGQFKIAIRVRTSKDGGATWSTPINMPHFGSGYGSADVSMVYHKSGLLYMSYIDYKKFPDSGGIFVARSTDDGLTWNIPTKVFDMYDDGNKKPIDRPWIVIDNSNSVNSGTIYVTSMSPGWVLPPNRNYMKSSSDSGKTWSAFTNVDGGLNLIGNVIVQSMPAPAVSSNGTFYASYPSYLASQNPYPAYYLAKSTNKGIAKSYTTIYSTNAQPLDTNYKVATRLIANPIDSNQLVFMLPSMANGDPDVMIYRSKDAGQTWSTAVRVNDDSIGNGKAQDMVWGNFNEKGKLVVTWRDRRDATTKGFWNAGYDFYYAISSDNGQTFSKNEKISSQFIAFDSVMTQSGNDMMCSAYIGDTLYATWGDTRTGKLNIFFTKTILSPSPTTTISQLNTIGEDWSIYPNPSSSMIYIQIPNELKGEEISIYNLQGKLILNTTESSINFDMYPSGAYFIKIGNEVKRFYKF